MKSVVFGAVVALGLATPCMAEVFAVSVPQPVQTYTVCQHGAKLLINDRASVVPTPWRGGGRWARRSAVGLRPTGRRPGSPGRHG